MKRQSGLYLWILISLIGPLVLAQDSTSSGSRIPDPKAPEFRFIGYWFTKSVVSDVSPTNELLRGQIIGRMFGPNTTNTGKTASYFEQRFVPMFIYSPSILDGVATFRSLFKIDMTWGDAAYGVGGNVGGGINGGQINLQTLLANVELRPENASWNAVLGLQRIFDNVRDPNVTAVSTAQTSAYKLAYFGTQGVGISVFGNLTVGTKYRAGYYQLYENAIDLNDDVSLWMLDLESLVLPNLEIGADAWYAWDHGKSAGGISILGQGLNSALAEYNGATRILFPTPQYEANIVWLGTHMSYGRDFTGTRWWSDAFVMVNTGTIDTVGASSAAEYASILGVAANVSLSYKYGQTVNDRIGIEALFTTGDNNGASDKTVSSVITGNIYGSPTAIYSNHRALLLFPDPKVVNRYYSAVHDIANQGLGVTALFANASHDFIPNKWSGKIGIATAVSNVSPNGGGNYIGSEFNLEAQYTYKVFLVFTGSIGYLSLGDFYDSPSVVYNNKRPSHDPWVAFLTMNWLMF